VNTWKVILATLVIFIAGGVSGVLLGSYAANVQQKQQRHWLRELSSRRPELRPPAVSPREPLTGPGLGGAKPQGFAGGLPQILRTNFLQKLAREIPLTAEQREHIEKAIAEGQERVHRDIWQTRERILAVLEPGQVKRFEELMRQSRLPGQRKGSEPTQPDRRLRDQPRRSLPPRDGPSPEGVTQPHPPAEPPVTP
jgi:hypothetical protein